MQKNKIMQYFNNYLKKIKSVPLTQITEHSHRLTLQILFEKIAENKIKSISILHEPKREGKFGSPDYKITNDSGIIGYIENKKIDANLINVIKSEQIKKYRNLSDNILITNYLDFVWIKGKKIQKESLCNIFDLQNSKFKLKEENVQKIRKLIENFFSKPPIGISTARELAFALAIRAKNLKDFLQEELNNQKNKNTGGLLLGLYETFQGYIFTDLLISEFADAFAQMLVYGLFQAKLNADTKEVTLFNAKKFIPQSFKLIRELVGFLDELNKLEYKNAKWIIDEVISIMNNLDLREIKKTMLFSKKVKDSDNIDTDPFIYFYETFLAAYDKKLRKSKGVYYTPPQVVNLIINSINNILQNTFKIKSGFADRKLVTVLDFATGTGTFLIEIFKLILNNIPDRSKKEFIIKEHILKNIYGFEYLIAPYTIAHLKLAQFLKEQNYEIKENERLQILLTNTLEPTDPQVKISLLPALTQEAKDAQSIKDKPILVITGNPPYSGHSKNTGKWISALLKGNDMLTKEKTKNQANYFKIDGQDINERNSKWLQDDYVKFIRFAQYKINKAGQGVVGIITNHSFLDNPTFRGMRQSLMETFDQMYFIDLHGNSRKKEKTPEGKTDKNVFDIIQGVCISLFIKKKGIKKSIYHTDFWGTREEKFEQCLNSDLQTIEWKKIEPDKPFYLFKPQNKELKKKYYKFWKITDIFNVNGVGMTTAHDNFVISSNKNKLLDRFKNFKSSKREAEYLHNKFKVNKKNGWNILNGWDNLQNEDNISKFIKPVSYRPFDKRYIFYENKLVWRTVNNVMQHFDKKNIGLITIRRSRSQNLWNYAFVSDKIISGATALTNLDINYFFPLYLYQNNGNGNNGYLFKNEEKRDNFTIEFRKFIKTKYSKKTISPEEKKIILEKIKQKEKGINELKTTIKTFEKTGNNIETIKIFRQELSKVKKQIDNFKKQLQQSETITYTSSPEEIFGYIYAVLHSNTFINTYDEFLKSDFPHIPFVENLNDFKKLSSAGWQLVQVHLQNKQLDNKKYTNFGLYKGKGDNIVKKPEYKIIKEKNKYYKRLYINQTQYFDNISENIYNFYIGGYKILSKYLKYKKDKELELDDIENIENIVQIIFYTIEQKEKIDKLFINSL